MSIKVIKNDDDYQNALYQLEQLMSDAPAPGSDKFQALEVLDLLVGTYEEIEHPVALPEPIEAIEEVMEAQSLKQRDLVPYIGSASKVSEVLSRKRPLTLPMIRALRDGLGIPAEVLIQEPDTPENVAKIDVAAFPFNEICKLGWLSESRTTRSAIRTKGVETITQFLAPLGGLEVAQIYRREGFRLRESKKMDPLALSVWHAEAIRRAEEFNLPSFNPSDLSEDFLSRLTKLSPSNDGPQKAISTLREIGIAVVILPHLRRTYLDGAAFKLQNDIPVVGLTLRHDRVDNFWFVLMHELAHVKYHLKHDQRMIVDDLDSNALGDNEFREIEDEADDVARNSLIPLDVWKSSEAADIPSAYAIKELAKQIGVHPAIVAGRVCYQTGQYKKYGRLLGHGEIRKLLAV